MHPSVHARSQPDKAAYIMAGSGTVVSYGQLEERSRRCAQLLRGLGLDGRRHHRDLHGQQPALFRAVLGGAAQRAVLHLRVQPAHRARGRIHRARQRRARAVPLGVAARDRRRAGAFARRYRALLGRRQHQRLPRLREHARPLSRRAGRRRDRGRRHAVFLGHHGPPQGHPRRAERTADRCALAAAAYHRRLLRLRRGHGVPVAGAAVSRRAAALLHDRAALRRHRDRDGEIRPGVGAGADRAVPRHALAVGADDVRAHAEAARGGARSPRPVDAIASRSTPPRRARARSSAR